MFLVGILKEIRREGNPLSNYLSAQENLLVAPKDLSLRSTKVLANLLNKKAILEIGLLIALVIETFSLRSRKTSDKMIQKNYFFLLSLF